MERIGIMFSFIVWQNLPVIEVIWTWFFIWRLQNYLGVSFKKLSCFMYIIRFVGLKLFMILIIALMSTGIGYTNAPSFIYGICNIFVFSFVMFSLTKISTLLILSKNCILVSWFFYFSSFFPISIISALVLFFSLICSFFSSFFNVETFITDFIFISFLTCVSESILFLCCVCSVAQSWKKWKDLVSCLHVFLYLWQNLPAIKVIWTWWFLIWRL